MDAPDSSSRKRLTASILEQRLRSGVHGLYNFIPDHANQHRGRLYHKHNNSNHASQQSSKKIQQQKLRINKNSNIIVNVDSNGEQRASNDDDTTASSIENKCELEAQVKKRLSLPVDTPIPDSFLLKFKNNISHLNLTNQPLSRIARRQSLSEIGFGHLSTYLKLHILGAGTYSTVYKGTSRLTNKLVALKEIRLEQDEGVPFTAIREVSLLKELKHNNIITLHDIIYTRKTLTLVFEFVDRDLRLKYCHDRRILHRDLKPQNILISLSGELKLADFGLARAKSVPTKTFTDEVVTLWYRPPDVLLGNIDYGTSIDMWGVGCIFFEMATGFTLFTGTSPKKQIEGIFEIIGTPDDISWPNIKYDLESCSLDMPTYPGRDLKSLATNLDDNGIDLLGNFLKCNPQSRISAQEAVFHQYFSPLPSEIHNIPEYKSIFSISSIKLSEELSTKGQLHNVNV